ncbi:MAG: hypothetical protein AAF579_06395 [Cyanobacteria bacterium P01_C01_bin.118]
MVVANYEFFSDVSFGLKIGEDIDRTLSANIENTPQFGEGAILMWKHWRTGTGPVSYEILVNGTRVSSQSISGDTATKEFTSLHELIKTGDIKSGENNIKFRVTDGTSTVRISDVVIFYLQKDVFNTRVADYEFFNDNSFELRIGADIDKTLPANIAYDPKPGEGAILMWKHWRTGTGPVSYKVLVNGTEVFAPTISGDTATKNFTFLHENMSTNTLNAGENNIEFRVTGGTGTVRISDVVIFYRRDIGALAVNEPVAGYEYFRDARFDLRIGGNIDETLSADIENTPKPGGGAILMWKHSRNGAGSVSYKVLVNGVEVFAPTISSDTAPREAIAINETINPNKINAGENNIKFEVPGGTSTLRISDVAIFYRNANAPAIT